MIALGEDELICDLAETYHIYNMRQFPCEYIAILAKGLRSDSRIKMKAAGLGLNLRDLLLAHIADNTAINAWLQSEDARKGKNRPQSFVRLLTEKIDPSKQPVGFTSGADFDAEWERIRCQNLEKPMSK